MASANESVDIKAVRERLMSKTDSPRMKNILSHFGTITDDSFVEPPDYYNEPDFVIAIDELCGSISDETFRLYPEELPSAV